MSDQLKLLVELQYLEDKKAALVKRRRQTPQMLAALDQEFSRFEGEYRLKQAELEHNQKMRRAVEQEIADLENKLKRSKTRMTEIKNNREYQATLKEIEELKRDIDDKEDQLLGCMENLETLKAEVTALESEVQSRRESVEQEKEQLQRQSEQISAKLARLEDMEQEVVQQLEPEVLKRWQFLVERQGGTAVAAVEHGVCQVCHLNLPPQKFIELQRNEQIMACPHCRRFIYWPGHEQYAFVKDDYEL